MKPDCEWIRKEKNLNVPEKVVKSVTPTGGKNEGEKGQKERFCSAGPKSPTEDTATVGCPKKPDSTPAYEQKTMQQT